MLAGTLGLLSVCALRAQTALPDAPSFAVTLAAISLAPDEEFSSSRSAEPNATPVEAAKNTPCIPTTFATPTAAPSTAASCPQDAQNPIKSFLDGTHTVKPLTVEQKAHLAYRNVTDRFNLLTIAGNSAYTIASDAHTAYGPGLLGFGRLYGTTLLADTTGETIGTFAVSSIFHEDPRYFRMPHANPFRRVVHAVSRVVIAQGDNGRPMLNYSNLLTLPISNELANLYVPGIETDSRATAQRIASGFVTEPIGTLIAEFLPDVASHIHIHILIVQRYLNQMSGSPQQQPGAVSTGN